MGTRFIATKECVHAHNEYKNALVQAQESDTIIIKKSLGAPGRVLRSDFALEIIEHEHQGAAYEDLKDMISGKTNCRYIYEGYEKEGFGWAGQVVGLINNVPTVQELFDEMVLTAENKLSRIGNMIGERTRSY